MRYLIHFFLCISFITHKCIATEKPLGILIQVKNKKVLNSKSLKDLIAKNKLLADRYYSSLKIQSFKLNGKHENDLKLLCEKIIKNFPEVTTCEMNLKLKPESTSVTGKRTDDFDPCTSNCSNSQSYVLAPALKDTVNQVLDFKILEDCDLFKTELHKNKNLELAQRLSPFWAQEYIGSDLLKEEIFKREIDTSNASKLLEIWDGSVNRHGEYVANLISGPFESSLINSAKPHEYIDLITTSDFITNYQKEAFNQRHSNSNNIRFINNSMGWESSDLIKQVVQKIAIDHGIVFITSAGNTFSMVDKVKRESSRDGHSIIVASHAPNGLSSNFTSFAPEVDITAPSDSHILSYDYNGKPALFGGTSGAAPLVTSTLLTFELIAGVELTTSQFKELLKKTAIRHQNDLPRKLTGAGYLNSYKIGAIAFKLNELCKQFTVKAQRDKCMLNSLQAEDLYDFSKEIKEDQIISNFESAFPKCGKDLTSQSKSISCEEKKNVLIKLRKAAFLMPENLKFWEKLSCIYLLEGLSTNADYYSRLAKGKRISVNERNGISVNFPDIIELITDNENSSDREFVLAAVSRIGAVFEFAPEALKKDREFVLAAVRGNWTTFKYVSETLKNDREFVLAAVMEDGLAIKYTSETLKNDRKIVLEAVRENGAALEYASETLKNDRKIVLAAVMEDGAALEYASEALKNDAEITRAGVKKSSN